MDLTKRIAHRVLTVRPKSMPQSEPIPFNFRGKRPFGIGNFYHLLGKGENERILPVKEFDQWEVVEVSHPGYLDEFWEAAYQAHYWSSQSPETLGEDDITWHEKELHEDLQKMPEEQRTRYIENYKRYFSDMLSSLSRCANAFVTGPAKFDTRRNEKANNVYSNKHKAFREWRERALKGIEKYIESNKSEEQKNDEAWQRVKKDIDSTATTINNINTGVERGYNKALFVSNLFGRISTFANNGNVEIVDKAIERLREWNSKVKKPIITERHKFFSLPELARNVRKQREVNAKRENKEVHINGVTVVWNYELDRLQLLFDKRPDKDTCNLLHRKFGFNWSRQEMAWQRRLTDNAVFAAQTFLNVESL